MNREDLLTGLVERLDRIARALEEHGPAASAAPAPGARAFLWEGPGGFRPVRRPAALDPKVLTGVEAQVEAFYENTRRFLEGRPSQDVLLWGERGTGKSSLVRSLLVAFPGDPLAILEVPEGFLPDLGRILDALEGDSRRWVIYLDDLSFRAPGDHYRDLKVLLEGGLQQRPENTLVVATSNRRHLLPGVLPLRRRDSPGRGRGGDGEPGRPLRALSRVLRLRRAHLPGGGAAPPGRSRQRPARGLEGRSGAVGHGAGDPVGPGGPAGRPGVRRALVAAPLRAKLSKTTALWYTKGAGRPWTGVFGESTSTVSDVFSAAKEQILSQYIIHHEVADADVGPLTERLDLVFERAAELHNGQRRKTGEEYIWHPVHTAMEVSRFGRITDWASIEAALLHDTLEDTPYSFASLQNEFPDAANLVLALTKIKDSRVYTYQKLFRYVLQDIRVLLVKLADRLDNLESLTVFKRDKQVRIARESAEMYANICRRLCMLDLADRLTEKIGPILTPDAFAAYQRSQAELKDNWARPLGELRAKLADVFPGDLAARIEVRWSRFRPQVPPVPENLFTVRIITETSEDAYRALGRVHLAFRALPGTFSDTLSTPRKNGYRALETRVAYQGRIVSFYIASRPGDRFNRLGLLSMDITSPRFNLQYLDDLREFLENADMDIQDFLRFHRPDAIQVTSPKGDVFSLEEGATALDYAFAVHEQLGLRARSAQVNGEAVGLDAVLRPGDRVEVMTSPSPSPTTATCPGPTAGRPSRACAAI